MYKSMQLETQLFKVLITLLMNAYGEGTGPTIANLLSHTYIHYNHSVA